MAPQPDTETQLLQAINRLTEAIQFLGVVGGALHDRGQTAPTVNVSPPEVTVLPDVHVNVPPHLPPPIVPPGPVTYQVTRGPDGLIESITATPGI